jgi:clan AA aspartic protease (TIGR02281 family)
MAFDSFMWQNSNMRWLLLAVATAGAVRADIIRLRNGNMIEGIVTLETDTQVVLDLGTGRTTLSRGTIAAVEHAAADENDRLRAGWKQKYFLYKKYVPAELAGLAADFAKLDALREEALGARRLVAELSAKEADGRAEQEQLRAQIVQTSQRLQQFGPAGNNNVEAYNALVASNNALQARWSQTGDALSAGWKKRDAAVERIAAYQETAAAFQIRFDEERKKPVDGAADAERRQFFDRMAGMVAGYMREFASAEVAVTQSRDGSVVMATVNEQTRGRFVVDTGAGRVTITEEFARRLKIDPDSLPEAEFTMADGHKTRGRIVVFRVLAVGDARAENIEAAIIPGKPGEQVDGLLGMSFLKHFSVNLDGGSGKLILRQFAPK